MALLTLARIALRPCRTRPLAVVALALFAASGCGSHRRDSLRPVYSAPATVRAPCTNCGQGATTGSGVIVSEPGATPSSSAPRSLSSEPQIEEPASSSESTVPPLGTGSGRSTSRSAVPEPAPEAKPGEEPQLDSLRSQSLKPSGTRGTSPSSPASKSPVLQGPAPAPTSSLRTTDGVRTAWTTGEVRQVNLQERLSEYFVDGAASDLFYPNKADRPWRYVVLHHSASATGSYSQIDADHRKVLGYDGCGYHFVIGNGTGSGDGQIEVAQRWINQKHGVHCRNAKNADIDEYSIGICFIGDLDKEPPTPRQLAAAKLLLAYLSKRYEIPRGRIDTHAHLAATPTVCPGKRFPADALQGSIPRSASAGGRSASSGTARLARGNNRETY
ncbi:MAG: N-acetylmuramoyl-L-alanine amidase [Planctomycetaceae bacterium]|nr:N-acetylmuramoyl-L-alanine amidase [Planctomycetaceae bacterium]